MIKIKFYSLYFIFTKDNTFKTSYAAKQPLWGKMTAQHMIEYPHTAVVAFMIIKISPSIEAKQRQLEIKKASICGDADIPGNLDNPAFRFALPEYANPSLLEAKEKLLTSLTSFFLKFMKPNPMSIISIHF